MFRSYVENTVRPFGYRKFLLGFHGDDKNMRALATLNRNLSLEQRTSLEELGWFVVKTSYGARFALAGTLLSYNIYSLQSRVTYCLLAHAPEPDNLLIQKLLLTAEPHRFFYTANRWGPLAREDMPPSMYATRGSDVLRYHW